MTPRRLFRLPWRTAQQIRRDVDDELSFHLDMRAQALSALGASPSEARAQALREFGDLDDARQYIGAVDRGIEAIQRRSDYMRDLWLDLSYAVRKLRATPAFSLAAVATLALGIGANTAIFSVVNSVLLRPLPFPHAERLVRVRYTQQGHGDAGTPMDLIDARTRTTKFVGFALVEGTTVNLIRDGADAERLLGVRVNANWFSLLRIAPLAGRFFADGEDEPGAANVVVIGEQVWRRDFGADPRVIGKSVRINAAPYTIIGVVASDRAYPFTADVWLPRRPAPNEFSDQSRGARWLSMLARVKDDVDFAAANHDIEQVSLAMEKQFPELLRERRMHLATLRDFTVGDVRKPLFLILGAVSLVLLIACANVANLMLVRATAREGEIAIRTALGAGRGRLARQLITESVVLSCIGAAVGLAAAKIGMTELLSRAPQSLLMVTRASIDGTALAVTAVVAIATGVLFGIVPALHVRRGDLATALRAGIRGARSRPAARRTKRLIVVGEVALATTLLTGAGLLIHSLVKLVSVDAGFRPEGVLSMKVSLPPRAYDAAAQRNFVDALMTRAQALPGVTSVALSNYIPFDGGGYGFSFTIRGRPVARPSDQPSTEVRNVTPQLFATLGTPIVLGRGIEQTDRLGAPEVLVVNRAFVRKFFPTENPIGQQIVLNWGDDSVPVMRPIVGVVGDIRSNALADEPEATVYVSMLQHPFSTMSILVRTARDPASLTASLRDAVRETDRELPVFSIQTMEDRVAGSLGRERFYAVLIGVFAGVALLLSAIGLYGVIAYGVSQRTHELGVRVALGAAGSAISRMVIGESVVLTAAGLACGVVGALSAGRLLSTLLYNVEPTDSITLAAVAVTLCVVAILASWIPARRAARVDPLVAMRGD
jgi:predicted permease